MPTYITQPRAAYFWDGEDCYAADRPSIEIHSDSVCLHDTGLLNANGHPLMRLPDTVPLGFHLR